jgi:hypothetical protein
VGRSLKRNGRILAEDNPPKNISENQYSNNKDNNKE